MCGYKLGKHRATLRFCPTYGLLIVVVLVDRFAPITTRGHVVQRTFKFYSEWSGHSSKHNQLDETVQC